jgi:hypothetical protein
MIITGPIALAFTILTNDGQEAVVKAALTLLQTAQHNPAGGERAVTNDNRT